VIAGPYEMSPMSATLPHGMERPQTADGDDGL
jgi:hypothetical protein